VNYLVLSRSPAFGAIVFRLDDNGFAARGNGWTNEMAWSAITACEVWRGAVLLRSGRLRVVYLPRRATTPQLVAWIQAQVTTTRDSSSGARP